MNFAEIVLVSCLSVLTGGSQAGGVMITYKKNITGPFSTYYHCVLCERPHRMEFPRQLAVRLRRCVRESSPRSARPPSGFCAATVQPETGKQP